MFRHKSNQFNPEPYRFYLWEDQGLIDDLAWAVRRKFKLAGLIASTWSPVPGHLAAVGIPVETSSQDWSRFTVPDFPGPGGNWAATWKASQWNVALDGTWIILKELNHYVQADVAKVRKAVLYRTKAMNLKALTWLDWPGCMVVAVVRPTCFGG